MTYLIIGILWVLIAISIIGYFNYIKIKEVKERINNKHKLYCLIGRSATGKSSVEKQLRKYGLLPVVSYTTRPIRTGEVNGRDYNFVSDEEFNTMLNNGDILEHAVYNNWNYGTAKSSIDLNKGSYIIVVNPEGFVQLQNAFGKEKVVGIFVWTPLWQLLRRSIYRQPNATEDQLKEICRRFISDFDTFKDADDICSLKVLNNNINDCANHIIDCIIGDLI
jgi:guanylate kinase